MWLGIDPGKHGAFVVVDADYQVVLESAVPMIGKDYDDGQMLILLHTAKALGVSLCTIERTQAMPKQGATSGWAIGQGFGLWRMGLRAAGLPYQIVSPSKWKGTFGINGDNQKNQAIILAKRLVPTLTMRPTPRSRVDSADHAEAALLAIYGMRQHG